MSSLPAVVGASDDEPRTCRTTSVTWPAQFSDWQTAQGSAADDVSPVEREEPDAEEHQREAHHDDPRRGAPRRRWHQGEVGERRQVEHPGGPRPVSYTHLRAHETDSYLVC